MVIVHNFIDILIATSIFFVWVIRYQNIVSEFKEWQLPDWLRDLTGIFKLTFAFSLILGLKTPYLSILGAVGVALLMGCAQIVHLRANTQFFKRLPSLALLALSLISFFFSFSGSMGTN
ncbi:MAG: DoxX family protein [Pseudomonadota bacterium]